MTDGPHKDDGRGGFRQRGSASLRRELSLLLAAAQFLTRLPLPAPPVWTVQTPTACLRHLPLVGAGIGLAVGGVLVAASLIWPPGVAALLALWASVALTGALHEDGWADSCDGLWGHATRERALEIMKDSRLGTYGVCGLVLMLGLRWALLTQISQGNTALVLAVLVWAHAGSRALAVALMALLPYAGDAQASKVSDWVNPPARLVAHAALGAGLVLLGVALVLLAAGLPLGGLVLPLGAWGLLLIGLRAGLRRRLGGYTGDTLGAAQQLGEAAALLVMTALLL
ncbi:adenosylcobinamide-GDP ribazoletransferase [Amphibiibacter pelophylacis]|uniref:Adenosylcobinamide-GDP ribazoletransferase n=1 Tax=Amphibiibacter pelophylacis TaxID=1799477 RepID=A0ACC6P5E0_9BURK